MPDVPPKGWLLPCGRDGQQEQWLGSDWGDPTGLGEERPWEWQERAEPLQDLRHLSKDGYLRVSRSLPRTGRSEHKKEGQGRPAGEKQLENVARKDSPESQSSEGRPGPQEPRVLLFLLLRPQGGPTEAP